MSIWSQPPEGPALRRFVQAAIDAGQAAYTFPDKAQEIAVDPRAPTLLPLFGMEQRSFRPQNSVVTRTAWFSDYTFQTFWRAFVQAIEAALQSQGQDDGHVLQTVDEASVRQTWSECRERCWGNHQAPRKPSEEHFPFHVAAAIATLAGPSWSVCADGGAMTRTLPAQPLRYPPRLAVTPPKLELKNGLLVDCVGWAYLPATSTHNPSPEHEFVYLSCVGPHKKLKAVWAALMDNKRDCQLFPSVVEDYAGRPETQYQRVRQIAGSGVYRTFWPDVELPESGLSHIVLHHHSQFQPRTARPFLHLVGAEGVPDLTRFVMQLDLASTLSIAPAWAPQLWEGALTAELITKLPSYGCQAYWVDTSDESAWARLVAQCAGASSARIERFGDAQDNTLQVAMVSSEQDICADE